IRLCCALNLAVVNPVVPYNNSRASNKATLLLVLANSDAVIGPAIPPPTTATSTFKFRANLGKSCTSAVGCQKDCGLFGNITLDMILLPFIFLHINIPLLLLNYSLLEYLVL